MAYLHIDVNRAHQESRRCAFRPRHSPGAFVLVDYYAQRGRDAQRLAMDAVARELDVPICTLPTGQGLIMKPAG
jgi:hypothetical protein